MWEALDVPGWVIPSYDSIWGCRDVAVQLGLVTSSARAFAIVGTLDWMIDAEPSPITSSPDPMTREGAHAERWAAVTMAAGVPEPAVSDWALFGVGPRKRRPQWPRSEDHGEWAYGTLRTLNWLLGLIEEAPVRLQSGAVPDGAQLCGSVPDRDSPAWQAANQVERNNARLDAFTQWTAGRAMLDRVDHR